MFENKNLFRWVSILISSILVSLILWNTYTFFQNFKEEERIKMNIWAHAFDDVNNNDDLNAVINELSLEILQSNHTTPMIIMNNKGEYDIHNINNLTNQDSLKVKKLINRFIEENTPIEAKFKGKVLQTIYYGNSSLINKLKYYPLALVLILFLFGSVVFFFYKSTKNAEQNKLWAGMAKETAHQIGTPLSSLIGWIEILKMENVSEDTLQEMTKDVDRLQTITERFSKIGSTPKLDRKNIVTETKQTFEYLQLRSSKLVQFSFEAKEEDIYVNLNSQLYSWTIENLIKNAIDAMKGKGELLVKLHQLEDVVYIQVQDTGKGIIKSQFRKIFEPGHTTKKRGWGLGLSLSKRIIEDYHNGRITVLSSEIDNGTVIQVSLKTVV
ncbi:MAG: HAMP domain-containing histidine kinase [Flavobacteriaceae bacterium]|nr:HAMP domain-containing histidine kinase [Flavobacteriaceae bacterium]